ncbi:MAG TPA: hypothetical protein VF584_23170 [Longimicrobium sp.]
MLRDVLLWSATDPALRGGLFDANAEAGRAALSSRVNFDEDVRGAVAALAAVAARPSGVGADAITAACREISRWAARRGWGGTAVAFAEAAALADPASGALAAGAGAVALRFGSHNRADAYLRRAVGLARRGAEWEAYAEALLGLAELHEAKGNGETARPFLLRACRFARRFGLRQTRGRAAYGLLRLGTAAADVQEVERYLDIAVRAFGRQSAEQRAVLRHVAQFWIASGDPTRAIPVLLSLRAAIESPETRLDTAVLLVRATAGSEHRIAFEEAWERASSLADAAGETLARAGAFMDLARAAHAAGERGRADYAARRAADAADQLGLGEVAAEARLLASQHRGDVAR